MEKESLIIVSVPMYNPCMYTIIYADYTQACIWMHLYSHTGMQEAGRCSTPFIENISLREVHRSKYTPFKTDRLRSVAPDRNMIKE